MSRITLEVILEKKEILIALFESRLSKSVIGVRSKILGPGTYFTTVKEMQLKDNDEVLVILQGYDMTGYFFDKSQLALSDIDFVVPFTALFENPFLRDLKRETYQESDFKLQVNGWREPEAS